MSRVIVWFSCGVASAVAAKIASEKYGDELRVVYCDTSKSEHEDNPRFMAEVEKWIGRPIEVIASTKYASVDDVFEKRRYMAGVKGALCTTEMKKIPRFQFQQPDDLHIFGMTAEEGKRIAKLESNNPELRLEWILRDAGISKTECFMRLRGAGIKWPAMYNLGYSNNNCIGCVKATSLVYWVRIRRDFPEVFAKRASMSRELGVRLTRLKGERIFLDEIPDSIIPAPIVPENVSCGPECQGKPSEATDERVE